MGRPLGQGLTVLFGNEAEIGVISVVHVIMRRAGTGADVFEHVAETMRGILRDRFEHFFLGLEVVVERARSEIGFPDNVPYRRRLEPDPGKDATSGIQDGPAVCCFGACSFAGTRCRFHVNCHESPSLPAHTVTHGVTMCQLFNSARLQCISFQRNQGFALLPAIGPIIRLQALSARSGLRRRGHNRPS